jgi:HK97 gp10 family phage protein
MIGGKWTGLEQALRNAEALGKDMAASDVIEPTLLRIGGELKEDIVRGAPRSSDAPHMADTFVVKASKEERIWGRTTVLVGPRVRGVGFVAPLIELGTLKMAARPFIRPAFDGWKSGFVPSLVGELQRQYERVVKKYTARSR